MALTATFAADFDRFERSIQQASVHLQTFDRATKTSTRSLTKEVESFSGQKLAVEAARMVEAVNRLGGASTLTDSQLRRLTSTLDEVAQKAARTGETVSPAIAKMRAEVEKLPKATTDTATGFGSALSSMIPFATAAGLVTGAVAGLTKVLTEGAQLATISQGFQALAGSAENAGATLQAMRVGTRGLVTDLDIMQSSNKAMLLGLGLNAQGMGDLAKTAQVLGRAMGLNATSALNDLIVALGRSSPLILDNLGLTVKLGEAKEKYAAQLGKVADELTDAESKQAFMNAAMEAARQRVAELGEPTLTLSERFSVLKTDVSNATAAFGAMLQTSPLLNAMFEGLIDSLQIGLPRALLEGQVALFEFAAGAARLSEKIPTLRSLMGKSAEDTKFWEGELQSAKDTLDAFDMAGQRNTATIPKLSAAIVAAVPPLAKHGEASKRAADEADKLDDAIRKLGRDASGSFGVQLMIASGALGKLDTELSKSEQAFDKAHAAMAAFGRDASGSFGLELMLASGALGKIATEIDALPPRMQSVGGSIRENMTDVFKSIPQLLTQAFTGGGGLMGAIKAIGVQLAQAIAKPIFEHISSAITKAVAGKVAGNVASGLVGGNDSGGGGMSSGQMAKYAAYATVIGAVGIGIWKIVQHNRQLNDEVKKHNAEIEKLQQSLIKQHGSLERLEAMSNALGLSFSANWGHQGQAGLEAFNALIEEFQARLDNANEQFDPLLRSADELGIRLPDAILLSIQRLRDLGILTEENAALLDRLAGAADVDWRKMQEAAERYGIGVDNLGQQFNQLRQNSNASQIINDFDLMTRGGASVGAVLSGMSDEISAFVQASIRAGTTIPQNMQEWIEELARTGQLVDENGDALTDLGRLRFADPIKTEFEIITEALEKLIASLDTLGTSLRGLSGAGNGINLGGNGLNLRGGGAGGGEGGGEGGGGSSQKLTLGKPSLFRSGGVATAPMNETVRVTVPMPDGGRNLVDFVMRKVGNRWAVKAN